MPIDVIRPRPTQSFVARAPRAAMGRASGPALGALPLLLLLTGP